MITLPSVAFTTGGKQDSNVNYLAVSVTMVGSVAGETLPVNHPA